MNVTNSLDEVTTIGPNLRQFLSELLSENVKASELLHSGETMTSSRRSSCETIVELVDELEYALMLDDHLEKLDPQLG